MGARDNDEAWHWETAQGALLQLAGKPAIMTSAMDPFDDFSGGLLKLTNSTGRREGVTGASATLASLTGGYTLFDSADYTGSYSAPTDHPLQRPMASVISKPFAITPIEIGNRVWRDSDSDGIQIPVNRRWPAWRCNCLLRWHHRAGDGHHRGRWYLLFFLGFRTKLNEQPQLASVGSASTAGYTVQIALNQAPLDGLTLTAK
ncbi:MAG: hypothetical protein R2867_16275 [Caldilineaceae bacterium]